jgi:hypothetical protein
MRVARSGSRPGGGGTTHRGCPLWHLPVDRRLLRWCRSGQPRTWRSCPAPRSLPRTDPHAGAVGYYAHPHGDRGGHPPPRDGVLVMGQGAFEKSGAHRPRRRARRGRDPRRRARPGPFGAAVEGGEFLDRRGGPLLFARPYRSVNAVHRGRPDDGRHSHVTEVSGSVRCGCQYPAEPVTSHSISHFDRSASSSRARSGTVSLHVDPFTFRTPSSGRNRTLPRSRHSMPTSCWVGGLVQVNRRATRRIGTGGGSPGRQLVTEFGVSSRPGDDSPP